MGPIWELLKQRPCEEPLFGCNYIDFCRLLADCAQRLGVSAVSYQMRHSGASIDRAHSLRSIESIQKRGRWQAQRSVRRYEKQGRINESWSTLTDKQQQYFRRCEESLKEVILHGSAGPAKPRQW